MYTKILKRIHIRIICVYSLIFYPYKMWLEIVIKSIEILPNWIIQIDLECDWNTFRNFSTQWEFFWMYLKAIEEYQKRYNSFQLIHQFKQHIEWNIKIVDDDLDVMVDDEWELIWVSKEKATQKIQELIQESKIDYDVWKSYILWC